MKRLRIVGLVLFITTCLAAAAQQFEPEAEQEIVRLVNAGRSEAGLGPLQIDERLAAIARRHSQLMLKKGMLSHQFAEEPDVRQRVISTGVRFDISGENVAYDRNAAKAHRSLMNSPPHRANILRPEFNAIGVGVVRVGDSIYVTQDFARRVQEFTPSQAESTVSRGFAKLRESAGAPLLPLVSQPRLRNIACDMAKANRLDTGLARGVPNARNVLVWTASDPAKLPGDMQKLRTIKASGFSVGACFASSESYPNPVWWMVAVTYF